MAEPAAAGSAGLSAKERAEMLAKLRDLLRQLEELEPRLAAASSPEVEMSLLERATEQVEEAGRLLERLGRVAG
jgi:acyl-CoA reductase-like NAD-dependent aldehyde dehydrogenase